MRARSSWSCARALAITRLTWLLLQVAASTSQTVRKNSIAVADWAFALIRLDRRIADNVVALRRGEWNKRSFQKGAAFTVARSVSSCR